MRIECGTPFFSVAMATRLTYSLVGDSSLYTKKRNGDKCRVSGALRHHYALNVREKIFCGGGLEEILNHLERKHADVDVIGISYFGNDYIDEPMDEREHYYLWQRLFRVVRQKAWHRAVFFVGGYAAKYRCSPIYDRSMDLVRKWVREAGFEVVAGHQEVRQWQLHSDKLHFARDHLEELTEFWHDLLTGASEGRSKRARESERSRSRSWNRSRPGSHVKRAKRQEHSNHAEPSHLRWKRPCNMWDTAEDEHRHKLETYFQEWEHHARQAGRCPEDRGWFRQDKWRSWDQGSRDWGSRPSSLVLTPNEPHRHRY